MNWLDIAFAGLALAGFIKGYADGFIRQGVRLGALIAAIYLFSRVSVSLKDYVTQTGWFPEYSATVISSALAFLLIAGMILLAGEVVHRIVEVTPLSVLNHLTGGVFGLIMTLILLSVALNMLERLDRRSSLLSQEVKVESRLYIPLRAVFPALCPIELFVWKK